MIVPSAQRASHRARRVALASLFAGSLALRLYGIDFGLPLLSNFYVRPDESLIVVPAVELLGRAGAPNFYTYPALMLWICSAAFEVYFRAATLLHGAVEGGLAAHFASDPSRYFLIARLLSALAGTATTLIVYRIAQLVTPPGGALIAALLYATAPLGVRDAHFGVTDTLLACLASATFLAVISASRDGWSNRWSAVLCGGLLGLTVASKYPGVLVVPIVAGAMLAEPDAWRTRLSRAATVVGVAAAVFVLVNPFVLLHLDRAVQDVGAILSAIWNYRAARTPDALDSSFGGILGGLQQGPGLSVGMFFAILAVARTSIHTLDGRRRLLLAAAAVAFVLPLLFTEVRPYRYVVPALPFMAVLAADGLLSVAHLAGRWNRAVLAGSVLLAVGPALYRSVQIDRLLAQEDTRTLAGRWIADHVPVDVPIMVLGNPECEPQIRETATSIRRRIEYVTSLYGIVAGQRIAELYRLQLLAPHLLAPHPGPAHEVWRRSDPIHSGRICVVEPTYPLPNPACPRHPGRMHRYRPLEGVFFEAVPASTRSATIDAIDAFFLPFSALDMVVRPGPNLRVTIAEPVAAPRGPTPGSSVAPH